MTHAHRNIAHITETMIYGKPRGGELVAVSRRIPVRILSLQQLKEVFAMSDLLTDGERQNCNLAID